MVLGLLQGAGYGRTEDPAHADLILLNTCAVREKAEEKVYARASMLAAHKARPGVVLGITGCMAEHLKGAIRQQAPYVDVVVGPDGYRRLLDHVERARGGAAVEDTQLDRFETYEGLDPARAGTMTGESAARRGRHGRRRHRAHHHPARLRQVLHVLRRPLHARARARHAAARGAAPGARDGRGRLQRSSAARSDRELVPARGRRLRRPAARGGDRRRDRAHPLHVSLSARFLGRGDRGDGGHAQGLPARAPAAADRVRHGARAHAARLQLRRFPAAGLGAARGDARHRDHHRPAGRLLRRDRGGIPDRARARSRSCASTARSCSRTRNGRARWPRARCPTPCRRR